VSTAVLARLDTRQGRPGGSRGEVEVRSGSEVYRLHFTVTLRSTKRMMTDEAQYKIKIVYIIMAMAIEIGDPLWAW